MTTDHDAPPRDVALSLALVMAERAHHRANHGDVIDDAYERGRVHALDDMWRVLTAGAPVTATVGAPSASEAVEWAAAELTPDITVVTGPPDDGVLVHPSTTGDVEGWLQARGYRWLWTGFDGHTLLYGPPGQPVTMARIGDRLRWASNRVRVEG